jgi:hypothetical protein
MLAPLGIDAHSDHDAVLSDLDAVHDQGHQIQLAEVTPEELGELLLGTLDEAVRDR